MRKPKAFPNSPMLLGNIRERLAWWFAVIDVGFALTLGTSLGSKLISKQGSGFPVQVGENKLCRQVKAQHGPGRGLHQQNRTSQGGQHGGCCWLSPVAQASLMLLGTM